MMDTTLAFTRLILDGFLDRDPRLQLIAPHGGGTLPYLAAVSTAATTMPPIARRISQRPSEYLRCLWYETVVLLG